jgi:hypothetical protein
VVAALLLAAPSAWAAGVSMTWLNCSGEGTGTNNRTFACNVNTGTNLLVTSFMLPADLAQVSGNELVVDVLSASDPLPDWWTFREAGTCRTTSLGFNTTANANDVVCVDWAQGQSAGGIGYYGIELGTIDPLLTNQHRRLKIALAVPSTGLLDLLANTEYFSCNITVNNQKTVGTGACAGCTEQMCLVLNSVNVTTPVQANNVKLSDPISAGSSTVTWQNAGPNCQLVPTRNATWGTVKSLYR